MRVVDILAIAGIALLLYGRILGYGFSGLDNDVLITANPIAHGLSIANVLKAFTTYDPELYIPLTILSYQINWEIAGLSPWIYHLTDLLLHIGCALLVAALVHELLQSRIAGVLAGVFFVLHPLHVETVVWPAARKDILMAFFALSSLVAFLRWNRDRRTGWYALSLVLFLASLFSKVSAIALPVLMMLSLLRSRQHGWSIVKAVSPYAVLSVIFGCVAIAGKAQVPIASHPIEALLLMAKGIAFTFGHFFVPLRLSMLYPQQTPVSLASWEFPVSLLAVVIIATATMGLWRRHPVASYGLTLFLLMLIPNFLGMEKNGFLYFAFDRYAYAASAGLLILISYAVKILCARGALHKAIILVLLCASIGFAWMTYLQVSIWKNEESLYQSAIRHYPKNPVALNNLGTLFMDRGMLKESLSYFERAAEEDQEYVIPWINMGHVYRRLGRGADAAAAYEQGIAHIAKTGTLRPYDLLAYQALSDYYRSIERPDLVRATEERARQMKMERE